MTGSPKAVYINPEIDDYQRNLYKQTNPQLWQISLTKTDKIAHARINKKQIS